MSAYGRKARGEMHRMISLQGSIGRLVPITDSQQPLLILAKAAKAALGNSLNHGFDRLKVQTRLLTFREPWIPWCSFIVQLDKANLPPLQSKINIYQSVL